MFHKVWRFFDRFEDHVRGALSRFPLIYAMIGAVGIVLIWKGIWESAEYFPQLYGIPSVVLGVIICLATGLLVSFFIGDNILISGLRGEKKLVEKAEVEVRTEQDEMDVIKQELDEIRGDLDDLKAKRSTGA